MRLKKQRDRIGERGLPGEQAGEDEVAKLKQELAAEKEKEAS